MSQKNIISGQFILCAGAFVAVIASFVAAAAVADEGRFVYVILLFLLFFVALFVPLSLFVRPMIERDAIVKYLDGMEKKVKGWSFRETDMDDLRRLKEQLLKKSGRAYLSVAARTTVILVEMERLEKARSSFFWDEREGLMQ